MALLITQDLRVPRGEVRTYAENTDNEIVAALLVGDYDGILEHLYEPSVVNYGEIRLGTPVIGNGYLFYFTSSLFWDHGTIENYGLISAVVPTAPNAVALFAPTWAPSLYNVGIVEAEAQMQAIAYNSGDGKLVVTNTETGIIRVRSSEAPIALRYYNGGTLVNHGDVTAHAITGGREYVADTAFAIELGPGGGSIFGVSIVNGGLIEASDENPATSRSAAIWIYGNGVGTIANSGTIRGDYAIREQSEPTYPADTGIIVSNSGLIEGRVFLDTGNDLIDNRGRIVGEIFLGLSADVLFSPNGELQGAVFGGDGGDVLFGSAGADTLNGEAGGDVIRGGGGADTLSGGAGADIFVYDRIGDSTAAGFDVIAGFSSGVDRIDLSALSVQSVSIEPGAGFVTLSAAAAGGTLVVRVEGMLTQSDLILSRPAAIDGTANADTLYASAAGSVLTGGGGDDALIGAAGNDRLDGGDGFDWMWGGPGDDVYTVDWSEDTVVELDGQGHDTVEVLNSFYHMEANVEDVVSLYAPGHAYLYGNALSNRMTGNDVGTSFSGGDGNDAIEGRGGWDWLDGGAGSDRMTGGGGVDTFVFTGFGDSIGYAMRSDGKKFTPDTVTDFVSGQDRIDLSAIDAVSATRADDAFTFIGTAAFTGHAGELRYEAHGAQMFVLGDIDGNGAAEFQIVINTPALLASDFIL